VEEKEEKSYRRRFYLINRPLQFRYMFTILFLLLLVMGATVSSMYYGIWGSIQRELSDEGIRNQLVNAFQIMQYEKARQGQSQPSLDAPMKYIQETELLSVRQREVFHQILQRTNKRVLLFLIPILIFIAWGSIFLSHRIAGPLYRFNQCFKTMREGDLTVRAHLRKRDEAVELSHSFNAMAQELDDRVSNLKSAVREALPEIPRTSASQENLHKNLSKLHTSK